MEQSLKFILPYPAKVLNPNNKKHWATKAVAAKKQRGWAKMLATNKTLPESTRYLLTITIHFPDKRWRDQDNVISSLKGVFDGLADGLKINDKQFHIDEIIIGEIKKHGEIVIEICAE